jgi:hypothetical protein
MNLDTSFTSDDKYGYESVAPDIAAKYDYGDVDAIQKTTATYPAPDIAKYGYEDVDAEQKATPTYVALDIAKYGYGDVDAEQEAAPTYKASRRSSLKQAGTPRRSSIGYTGEVTVTLPGRSEPLRRRTSISFNDYDEVKTVEPISALTNEPKKLWYQSEEYDQIKERIFLLLDLAASDITENRICTRGLERHLCQEREKLKEEQHLAWYGVFLEQYMQRNEGVFDDETVSKIYEVSTMDSKMQAMQRGLQDAADVESDTR